MLILFFLIKLFNLKTSFNRELKKYFC